jgi:hypothetical protein
MVQYIEIIGSGLLLYLLLCAIACLAGYGLLRLLGLATASPAMMLLAPAMTLVFWSLVVGIAVGLRAPMKEITPWLWGVSVILALNGLRRPWLAWQYESALLLLCAALPMVIMARYFWHGISDYSGSVAPDGWAYITYGQYLWDHQRGAEGGLAPLYQFAAHLSGTRYISAALLGFFSPLVSAGDTQTVSSLFQAWTLFSMACAVAFFWATETTKLWMVILATVLSTVAGWIANLIWANNFDNGLALTYLPAFAGLIAILEIRSWRWWILLGSMLAALVYTYPELAPLIAISVLLIALPRLWRERHLRRIWLGAIAAVLFVTCVLILPALPMLTAFVLVQSAVASATTARPGEGIFSGVIAPRFFFAAIWGLGGEHQIISLSRSRNLLGIVLTAIAALGTVVLLRRHKWGLAAAVVFLLIVAAYFTIRQRYSYATYKLLVINWWGIVAALVTGIDWMIERVRQPVLKRGVVASFTLLLLLVLSQSNHINAETTFRYINSPNQQLSAEQFRQLRAVKAIIGNDAVTVLVNEWLANQWAVYYLRDIPIDLAEYRMYMAQAHVLPVMHRAQVVSPEQARYVLTDATLDNAINVEQHWQMVWSGGPYRLWRPKSTYWATITDITNANGLEQLDGEQFFWVGQGPTVIRVLAAHTGVLQLSANMLPGPSLPERSERIIQLAANGAISQTVTIANGHQVLEVPVVAGENTITLTALDKPSMATTNGSDARPLLLGVKGLAVALRPESASSTVETTVAIITNANGLEQLDSEQFFWIGQGPTVIRIRASHSGVLQLSANMVPGPSLPEQSARKLQVVVNNAISQTLTIENGYQVLAVPAVAGENTITLTALDKPSAAMTNGNDPRPLLLGVKGLEVALQPGTAHQIGQLTLRGIENPNGLERVDGQQFFWVGQGTTVLHILSNRPGVAQFSTVLTLGPSLPNKADRQLHIATDHSYQAQMTVGSGMYTFTVPVTAGTTDVLIKVLDTPSQIQTGQGDQRPLLLGMKGLRMWFQEQ